MMAAKKLERPRRRPCISCKQKYDIFFTNSTTSKKNKTFLTWLSLPFFWTSMESQCQTPIDAICTMTKALTQQKNVVETLKKSLKVKVSQCIFKKGIFVIVFHASCSLKRLRCKRHFHSSQ